MFWRRKNKSIEVVPTTERSELLDLVDDELNGAGFSMRLSKKEKEKGTIWNLEAYNGRELEAKITLAYDPEKMDNLDESVLGLWFRNESYKSKLKAAAAEGVLQVLKKPPLTGKE